MRILIVDDDALNRFLLVHMLEEAGYTDCYEAESGREALQLAKKIDPDLVLLDVVMPGMDGFEVAPILKQMAGDTYLPIIFITAFDDHSNLVKCLEVGGDDFASKPCDKVILTAKIRAHGRTRELSKNSAQQKQELTYFRNAVEREHAIVEHIFKNAVTRNKSVERYFDYRLAPASNFNGDLLLLEPSPSGGIYVLMGDFTGHGLASAIGALPVTKAFHAMAEKGLSVSEMASTINTSLMHLLPVDMFFAAAIVEISNTGCHLNIWAGGMPDLILIDKNGNVKKSFASQHMALGILENDEFEDHFEYFDAEYGDRLLGYSDGLVELQNTEKMMLGEEALMQWITSEPDIGVNELHQKIELFRGDAIQQDDITLVSYTCQPLDDLNPNYELSQLPFSVKYELSVDDVKQLDPIYDIVTLVASQEGMQSIRSDLSTVLSELYNNALDHGLLKMDSSLKKTTDGFFEYFDMRMERLAALEEGNIDIAISFFPSRRQIEVQVTDSGPGFDWRGRKSASDTDSFGRGIRLVNEMCSSVEYIDKGNCVRVTLDI